MPHDNLTMLVSIKPDGTTDKKIVASIAESVKADAAGIRRLKLTFTR